MQENRDLNDAIFELMELGADPRKVGAKFGMTGRAVLNSYNRTKKKREAEKAIRENHGDWLLQFSTPLRKSLEYCGIYNENDLYAVIKRDCYIPGVGASRVNELNGVISKRLTVKHQKGYTVIVVED